MERCGRMRSRLEMKHLCCPRIAPHAHARICRLLASGGSGVEGSGGGGGGEGQVATPRGIGRTQWRRIGPAWPPRHLASSSSYAADGVCGGDGGGGHNTGRGELLAFQCPLRCQYLWAQARCHASTHLPASPPDTSHACLPSPSPPRSTSHRLSTSRLSTGSALCFGPQVSPFAAASCLFIDASSM